MTDGKLRLEETLDGWWSVFVGTWWTNVEGDAKQWSAIADAIERRASCRFKRVAYDPDTGRLSSPRNTVSDRDQPCVAGQEAGFVAHVREVVTAQEVPE